MHRLLPAGLVCVLAFAGAPAWADHFAIDLEVRGPAGKPVVGHAQAAAIGAKPKPRGVLQVKAGDTVTVKWNLRSTAAKEVVKDVVVHFFAVKEDQAGQATVPRLDRGVLAESALSMDFKPKDQAKGELSFQVAQAGAYLVRLETIGAAGPAGGHEHFAAIDVVAR